MEEENHEDWSEAEDPKADSPPPEIQRLLAEMERKAKKAMNYLVLEGFVERTADPDVYKYTPEGLVLAQQQYKKMREDGLI
jgi:hypothetical protein